MAFPEDPLGIKGEMLIDGTWVDVTAAGDIRLDDSIIINRGRQNEQGRLGPSRCNFKLDNREGKYSNRNPRSPYYGLIPLNTQFRASVVGTEVYMDVRQSPTYYFTSDTPEALTTDKAALDITGDIDIRIDVQPDIWNEDNTRGTMLAGKYKLSGDQRAWLLMLNNDATIRMFWSPNGTTAARLSITSTEPVPTDKPRRALRVTLDVNNGAGGHTARFYYADTIDDAWTQLGTDVVVSGTTSIFNSNADLEVGTTNNGSETHTAPTIVFNDVVQFIGRIYGFKLYNGIAGSLVANFDPTSRSAGDTSWSDGLGNTWNVLGVAELTADNRRFTGEIASLPQYWDTTGSDVTIPVTAAGIIRRLTQGASPLRSPIYRNLIQYSDDAMLYYPFEDDSLANTASSALTGAPAGVITDVTFGFDESLPASKGVVRINSTSSRISGRAKSGASGNYAFYLVYFKYPSVPASTTTLIEFTSTGRVVRWRIEVSSTSYRLIGYDGTGAEVSNTNTAHGSGAEPDQWIAMRILLTESGANTLVDMGWYPVGANLFYLMGQDTYSGTTGRPTGFQVAGDAVNADLVLAHVFMAREFFDFISTNFVNISTGWTGERAGRRFIRLAGEEALDIEFIGDPDDTELMGVQPTTTLMDILYEIPDVDGGQLYESRYRPAVGYRTRRSIENQPGYTLDYTAHHLTNQLVPVDDDQNVRNAVTVGRPLGGSATSVVESGPYSILPPPNGVGKYESGLTKNAATDGQLAGLAQYETFLGTWDEARYPTVQVNLNRAPFLADQALFDGASQMDLGGNITLTNMPEWLPPEDVYLLVQGYRETLKNRDWEFVWNTSPYGPYKALNDLSLGALTRYRVAAADSRLSAAITSGQTSFNVKSPNGKLWGSTLKKPGNFPIDIMIGGERMTVAAISGTTSPQTFTGVTRSVNGIVKAHSEDDDVQVAEPFYVGL